MAALRHDREGLVFRPGDRVAVKEQQRRQRIVAAMSAHVQGDLAGDLELDRELRWWCRIATRVEQPLVQLAGIEDGRHARPGSQEFHESGERGAGAYAIG